MALSKDQFDQLLEGAIFGKLDNELAVQIDYEDLAYDLCPGEADGQFTVLLELCRQQVPIERIPEEKLETDLFVPEHPHDWEHTPVGALASRKRLAKLPACVLEAMFTEKRLRSLSRNGESLVKALFDRGCLDLVHPSALTDRALCAKGRGCICAFEAISRAKRISLIPAIAWSLEALTSRTSKGTSIISELVKLGNDPCEIPVPPDFAGRKREYKECCKRNKTLEFLVNYIWQPIDSLRIKEKLENAQNGPRIPDDPEFKQVLEAAGRTRPRRSLDEILNS